MTWEERQQYRERLLAVTKADVVRVSEEHLGRGVGTANVCIVGDETKVPAEVQSGTGGWKVERVDLSAAVEAAAEEQQDGSRANEDRDQGLKTTA